MGKSRSLSSIIRRTSTLLAAALMICIGTTSMVANATSNDIASSSVNAQSGCGVRVYMTASGGTGFDATADANVKTSLETGTDLCITIGVQYFNLSTVSGSLNTTNYDVIYVQGQNNWGGSSISAFGANDYQVLDDFLMAGGGVVVAEWIMWDLCVSGNSGGWPGIAAIMPVTIRSGCAYESNQNVRFYRWGRPTSPLIDTGVASDFIFVPQDYAGSLSVFDLRSGATPYYWATWDTNVNNVPPAVDPANLPAAGGLGMAGWVPAGKVGRVFAFATTNGNLELTDTSAGNSFRRLLVNSLGWSGSVGGSVNPDAVAVSTSTGSNVSTQALTTSRISGTVLYSISAGSLPAGLTLNSSTGQITGTPSQTGTFTVTIRATGSQSGQAEATMTFTISAGQTTSSSSTSTSSTTSTTVAQSSTTSSTTSTTSTTVAQVGSASASSTTVSGQNLPTTGSAPASPSMFGALLTLVGVLLMVARRRLLIR
jgi:Putative Ig domain